MLKVTSEVGRLREVLLHEPGLEIDLMVPDMMEELLFDDIVYGEHAREEHARLRRVLQFFGVEVHEAAQLLSTTLADEEARRSILDDVFAESDELSDADRERLDALEHQELASILVAGLRNEEPRASGLFKLPPLPNYCFQRDPLVILGDAVIFSAMATAARHREALLSRSIFRFHPRYKDVPVLLDLIAQNRSKAGFPSSRWPHLEGGDVLVLSRDVIAVGWSQRTNRAGIQALAKALSRRRDHPPGHFILSVESTLH